MVTQVLEERFGAKGRVIHLMNHATTTDTLAPGPRPLNLQRAGWQPLAKRMDRDNDLLVVYLHLARRRATNKLAASHWPLSVPWLTPRGTARGARTRPASATAVGGGVGLLFGGMDRTDGQRPHAGDDRRPTPRTPRTDAGACPS